MACVGASRLGIEVDDHIALEALAHNFCPKSPLFLSFSERCWLFGVGLGRCLSCIRSMQPFRNQSACLHSKFLKMMLKDFVEMEMVS